MFILGRLRWAVGGGVRAGMRRDLRRFLHATADCRTVQQRTLERLLALNRESRFGRAHRLDEVRTVADFRHRLPVTDYEYFREPIEQVKNGDAAALLGPQNRLLMFCLSSGTTAQSKFIPITQPFLRDYRRGWQIWSIQTYADHPATGALNIVQMSSDHDRYRTAAGVPCGNISGLVAVMQNPLLRTMYSVPHLVSKINTPEAKQYTTVRLALADEYVGSVTTANPSTLIHLAKLAETHAETLIRDIADGTLTPPVPVGADIRRQLRGRIGRRRPRRARQLERILERTGRLHPRDYWPHLQVVAVWTGGSAGAYLHTLRHYYGDRVAIRDHGLSASEGRMTIPLCDGRSAGVLDITSHFFEFIPAEEGDSGTPTVLEAHELKEGRDYFILLTTPSGLYRYNICDVVRCTGFHGTTPLLEFLHKGAHIANLTGEKISESQAVTAVRRGMEELHLHPRHFTLTPVWGDPPQYRLLAEEQDVPSSETGRQLAERADRHLQELNCEYREKRETGRLAPLQWLPLPEGTWKRFADSRQRGLGASFEQYKHPCLVPDLHFCDRLLRDFAPTPREPEPQAAGV